jgi:flavin reductase (DIM6/NTAB) family NADH-FMN oxidoreductase RutF
VDILATAVALERDLTPAAMRQAFGSFPTGVTALAGLVDAAPVGMAASSFTSVSLDPPLASVCIAVTSTTWPRLRRAERIGVSVLGHRQRAVCRRLAARGVDRFAGLDWQATPDGAVLLAGAGAWFDCSLTREIPAGDHTLVLLTVHRHGRDPRTRPLVFHGSSFGRLADPDPQDG